MTATSFRFVHDVFVGRDDELATLRAAFDGVRREGARTVVIDGEAGIGKSTLVERFLSELEGLPRLRASGDESESHVRFALADQLLRSVRRERDRGRHSTSPWAWSCSRR